MAMRPVADPDHHVLPCVDQAGEAPAGEAESAEEAGEEQEGVELSHHPAPMPRLGAFTDATLPRRASPVTGWRTES